MSLQDNVRGDFKSLFEDAIRETGRDLKESAATLATYAAERSAHLSTLVGDPDFAEAVRAERDAVALRAGIEAVDNADQADARFFGIVHGALTLGARALVATL